MILLIYPNQLYHQHPGLEHDPKRIILIEDSLFFGDEKHPAKFHKQKLWLHRASMKRFEKRLQDRDYETLYVDYQHDCDSCKLLTDVIEDHGWQSEKLAYADPTDFLLEKRLERTAERLGMDVEVFSTPGFLNTPDENHEYRKGRKRWFMADFYKWQRQRLGILIDDDDDPVGGQWSFDEDNRKKIPKKLLGEIPERLELKRDKFDSEAIEYVQSRFDENPGSLETLYYPTSSDDARKWLDHFLQHRFSKFGDYEDAIEQGESWLWHSVLTPALNIGLLTPDEVVQRAIEYAQSHEIPINSLEGFIRQVIGWREFMRATYQDLGVKMRTANHWSHQRPMPNCFYEASTGILPVDDTIQRIHETGYCHHIERLMVLGGMMFLCEIDPKEIYKWFMEMFVDSYDWVMVPNVYAMSQHADGGSITTKPYFSGSSYVRKMSHYKQADWCDTWDGLYWRWIWIHHDELSKNPRWAMMCSMAKKMDSEKRQRHLDHANSFLETLS